MLMTSGEFFKKQQAGTLYPFRKLIKANSILGSKISAILYMEEVHRYQEEKR